MKTEAIQIEKAGGPDVMRWVSLDLPDPGPGEVRMKTTAVGLNFIDVYHRSGLYPMALPAGLGVEAAGVIEAIGPDVTEFVVGDRVATFGPKPGAYATHRNVGAGSLFLVPDGVSDEQAAAGLLKGCTVEALVERCAKVQPRWTVLVHAAAGGVGLILVQWLKHIGATVIGTVSNDEKAKMAIAAGADQVIRYDRDDVAKAVRELTGGKGVEVTFDGVGAATWEASLASTARRGLVASFGNASGPVTGVSLSTLANHGSLFTTRYGLYHYYVEPEERAAGVRYVFDMIANGVIDITINQRYALKDVAQAHRDLEARKTCGSTVLIP
jgi:NADPH2:quinone reductase